MSNKAISTALSTHLKAMTGLPPVAWENATFTPTNGTGGENSRNNDR
jgi:hypothetical protein